MNNRLYVISLIFFISIPACGQAYGPEGMFGGRINPDSTYTINIPQDTSPNPARGESVLQHPRPDYDPQPISVGSFNLYPSLETGATYDSNIFATKNNAQSDGVFDARPILVANSNWDRNALSLVTFGDFNYYDKNTSENNNDAAVQAQGRIDVMEQTWIALRGGYQNLIEQRGLPADVAATTPTTFSVYSGGISAYRGVGIINAQIDYDWRRLDYGNTSSPAGTLDTSTETRDEQTLKTKIGYDLTQNLKPYIQVSLNKRDYDSNPTRNSHGYEADAGFDADFGGIVFLNAYAGWLAQNYYNFGSNEINDGFDFGGRAVWNITGLTSIVAEASRTIEEDPLSSFNSFMATGGSLTLTHELRRNVLIEGDLSYTHDSFQGAGTTGQNYPSAGGGVRWLINQHFYTDLMYNYQEATPDIYMRNIVSLRLNMQL